MPVSRPTIASSGKLLMVAAGTGNSFGAVFSGGAWSGQTDLVGTNDGNGSLVGLTPAGASGGVSVLQSGSTIEYATWSAANGWMPFTSIGMSGGSPIYGLYPQISSYGPSTGLVLSQDQPYPPPEYSSYNGSTWSAPTSVGINNSVSASVALTSYGATFAYVYDSGPAVVDLCGTTLGTPTLLGNANLGVSAFSGGPQGGSPRIVSLSGSGPDMLLVVAIAPLSGNGNVFYSTRTGTTWSTLARVDTQYEAITPVSLAALPGGGAVLGFVGEAVNGSSVEHSVYAYVLENGKWSPPAIVADLNQPGSPWSNVGDGVGVAAGVGGDTAELVFLGADAALGGTKPFHSRLQGSSWSSPQPIAEPQGLSADYDVAALTTP